MGDILTLKLFVVYLKIEFNWELSILFANLEILVEDGRPKRKSLGI